MLSLLQHVSVNFHNLISVARLGFCTLQVIPLARDLSVSTLP